jgi:SAM-dependent MidA family methyltransferase
MGLKERIAQRIDSQGPLPFDEFMQQALYDPEEGFFATSPVGQHFATSPHVSPVFAACIASLLSRVRTVLPEPTLLEVGCGDATLVAQIAASAPSVAAETDLVLVDRDPEARRRAEDRGLAFRSVRVLSEVPIEPIRGVVFSNELFDNIPFHRIRSLGGSLVEVAVGRTEGGFTEVTIPARREVLAAATRLPAEGEEVVVSPASQALLGTLAEHLQEGYLVAIDYGDHGDHRAGGVRGYRDHGFVEDVLDNPGTCDITGPVDFEALLATTGRAGLAPALGEGIVSQRELLMRLGYKGFVSDMASRQAAAETRGDHKAAVAIWNARGEASVLVDEAQLGGLGALVMRTPQMPRLG